MARAFWLILFVSTVRADALEDAARALARSVVAQLAPNEIARVSVRNLSSLARADVARAQLAFEQTVAKRVRDASPIEIALTISENIRGFLFIADFKGMIEMEPYTPAVDLPARFSMVLSKRLLWQQADPVLDLIVMNDQMLVLDISGVTRNERREGKWSPAESAAAPSSVRDPRGRLTITETTLTADLPGLTCHGDLRALALNCAPGSVFSAGRNTFEAQPPFFSDAQIGNTRLVAMPDGRTYINDVVIENWGSDLAVMATCVGPRVAVTGAAGRDANDSITLYDVIQSVAIRVSDPVQFPGPVTALWPRQDSALAVVHNLTTRQYEAYEITADCSR
ncbi:MAG TPA: hypothetical protein VMG40_05085 [Bryobacteraceae bacterium]|nr:hypothetical protein [Bryobacteraceae bacterium]